MQCPGQDTRYWKPDDIFDIPCQACGTSVEFFKNDVRRRCPRCGTCIQNPKISLGCAQWCAHAKECLGFDPKALELAETGESSLSDRLAVAVKAELGETSERVTHSLVVLDEAQDLMRREEGDPRLIMAAALLHELNRGPAVPEGTTTPGNQAPAIRRILKGLGLETAVADAVCGVVAEVHGPAAPTTAEGRIVRDADRLARMAGGAGRNDGDAGPAGEGDGWCTAAGREKASALLAARRDGRWVSSAAR